MGVRAQIAIASTGLLALVAGLSWAWPPLGLIVGGGLLLAIGMFADFGGDGR